MLRHSWLAHEGGLPGETKTYTRLEKSARVAEPVRAALASKRLPRGHKASHAGYDTSLTMVGGVLERVSWDALPRDFGMYCLGG